MGFVTVEREVTETATFLVACTCDHCGKTLTTQEDRIQELHARPDLVHDGYCFTFWQLPNWTAFMSTTIILCNDCKRALVDAFPCFVKTMKFLYDTDNYPDKSQEIVKRELEDGTEQLLCACGEPAFTDVNGEPTCKACAARELEIHDGPVDIHD